MHLAQALAAALQPPAPAERAVLDLLEDRGVGRRVTVGDAELLGVAAPFLAFRALVMANPLWYPKLAEPVRATLLRFIVNVLDTERFEPARIDEYLT